MKFLVMLLIGCASCERVSLPPVTTRVAGEPSGYMVVAGQRLPVHTTTEPRADVVFVAPAGSALAQHHRDQMLRFAPCGCKVEYGAVDPSTTKGFSLRLIHVNRDAAGKLYLYRPCGHSPSRAVIGDGALLLLGGEEDWRLPIVALTRDEQGVALQLDVSKVPEVFRPPPEWRYHATSRLGLYEDGDERPAFMMTPEEAAKLDVVVRLCRKEKMDEFEFDDPHSQ
jgi:hypothetical protein